jgi:arginyl-tRNA synthetase
LGNDKTKLKDLEMAKKRDHKIMITDEAISKVPRIQYKGIPESEYNTIQELAKNVLQISKDENDSNEVAITYSMNSVERIQNGEEYVGVALGCEHDVDPISNTTAYHLVVNAKECIVIILHNHPSLSDFSLSDVKLFLEYASIKMMVVITNLGSITYLVKDVAYSYKKAVTLLNEAINMNNEAENLKDLQRAADYFLKNCYSVGINYDDR